MQWLQLLLQATWPATFAPSTLPLTNMAASLGRICRSGLLKANNGSLYNQVSYLRFILKFGINFPPFVKKCKPHRSVLVKVISWVILLLTARFDLSAAMTFFLIKILFSLNPCSARRYISFSNCKAHVGKMWEIHSYMLCNEKLWCCHDQHSIPRDPPSNKNANNLIV